MSTELAEAQAVGGDSWFPYSSGSERLKGGLVGKGSSSADMVDEEIRKVVIVVCAVSVETCGPQL